jgi:DnaD/phage-associated family protein
MSNQGWFKFYREIFDKPIWLSSTPEQKVILITLLGMANHQENQWEFKGEKFTVKPGQFITSLQSITEKCGKGISIKNVRTALERFEKYEFLANESTNKNRLITIVNWAIYQGDEDEPGKQNGKQPASNRQATGKQPAANKNVRMLEGKEEINNTTNSPEKMIMDFWDANGFGYTNLNAKTKLLKFLDEGLESDVIIRALEIATEVNKISYAYVEKILIDWSKRGLTNLQAVKAAEAERNKQMDQQPKTRGGYSKKPIRSEGDPDEIFKRQKEQAQQSPDELERKRREIEEMLKAVE